MLTEGPVVASWWQGVAGELMGTTGRAPNNESGGGAHRGWRSTMRRGGGLVRWRAAGSSLEGGSVVTPASSWSCGGGYAVVRAEPLRKRKCRCRAHRGGKWRWRFGANLARVVALLRSRLVHGLCGGGRKAVPVSFGAECGRGMKGRSGGHRWLLTKGRGGMGGGPVWTAPHVGRRGVRRGRHHAEEGGGASGVCADRGAWLAGVGGGRPTRVKAGDEGGGGPAGVGRG
jgi:hypothetical protein